MPKNEARQPNIRVNLPSPLIETQNEEKEITIETPFIPESDRIIPALTIPGKKLKRSSESGKKEKRRRGRESVPVFLRMFFRNGTARTGKPAGRSLCRNRAESRSISTRPEVTERRRRRDKEVQQQRQYTKIEQSKCNIGYKYIRTIGLPEYSSKEGRGHKLIAQARCGNLENWNKYWEEEEGRRCDLCGDRFGNLEHLTRDCKETDRDIRMEDVNLDLIISCGGMEDSKEECLHKLANFTSDFKCLEFFELKKSQYVNRTFLQSEISKKFLKNQRREVKVQGYDVRKRITKDGHAKTQCVTAAINGHQGRTSVGFLASVARRIQSSRIQRVREPHGGIHGLPRLFDNFMTHGSPVVRLANDHNGVAATSKAVPSNLLAES
ncbi:hypothetical protein WH47_12607 [Habropoda laboriosa]|uniref:Uncharacterized protein n=1 Tax=Habropoda laboriosa TaxID=597456 RepID=A0A0L7R7E3_9HYME|nr:hypothetical protein WH47_12607 [Habropoda laboriosa]